jgi:hypothetical protein
LGDNETITDCNGRKIPEFGDIPKSPVFRIGGSVHTGFFVPPQTANYTFHLHTHGIGKVYLR